LIVGLDGASFNILDPLIAQGALPNLARIAQNGLRTELISTMPPATLPAWTSFLTACSPSVHGITDLWLRRPGTHQLTPAQGSWRGVPTWMQMLAAHGLKVACLGMPGTYPPERACGVCIAGFDAPGAHAAGPEGVWPPSFYRTLQNWGGWRYATFNEQSTRPERHARAVDALFADIAAKEAVALKVQRMRRWDVFAVHLQASDTVGHHLWHTFDAASPRHRPRDSALADALPRIYRRLDATIGRLRAQAPPNCRILVVSDHGMGGADTVAVHLNRVLAEMGLLHFVPPAVRGLHTGAAAVARHTLGWLPTSAMGRALRRIPARWQGPLLQAARGAPIEWTRTQAFSFELDYAPAIWLHRRDAFADGIVAPAQAETLRRRISEALLALRHPNSGAPLVAAVHPRETLGGGPYTERFPDLVLEPAWPGSYRPSFLVSPGPGPSIRELPPQAWTAPRGAGMPGVHRQAGVLLAEGPELAGTAMPVLHIAQAGALVYHLMGVPLPAFADGALPDVWQQFVPRPQRWATPPAAAHDTCGHDDPVYSTAHSAGLIARLRALGYLD
jgi:predicted AlkP superfamily phosphohydrolase/phosphomutase